MNFTLSLLLSVFSITTTGWMTNMDSAKELAKKNQQLILLNFSGSDWCIPCIRMHEEIFEHPAFRQFADTGLVLVNADFPRSSKHKLSKEQVKHNEKLADQYNPNGKFPLTLLLTPDGKVLKEWDGLPSVSAEAFTQQLKLVSDAAR